MTMQNNSFGQPMICRREALHDHSSVIICIGIYDDVHVHAKHFDGAI